MLLEPAVVLEVTAGSSSDIGLVNEHWLQEKEVIYFNAKGYKIDSAFCRNGYPYGGAEIVVREQTDVTVFDV